MMYKRIKIKIFREPYPQQDPIKQCFPPNKVYKLKPLIIEMPEKTIESVIPWINVKVKDIRDNDADLDILQSFNII